MGETVHNLEMLSDDEFDAVLAGLGDDGLMGFISPELARMQIVRPKEVMKLLGMSRATLYRAIKQGGSRHRRCCRPDTQDGRRQSFWPGSRRGAGRARRRRVHPLGRTRSIHLVGI